MLWYNYYCTKALLWNTTECAMVKLTRKKILTECINLLVMIAGAFCLSLAMHMFMLPSKFIPGGVSGLTIIIQTLSGFSASYSMLILNAPLVILAFIFLKKEFAIKSRKERERLILHSLTFCSYWIIYSLCILVILKMQTISRINSRS